MRDIMFVSVSVSFFILIAIGCIKMGNRGMENEAVKMGHAKYVVDDKGSVSFEWLATQTTEVEPDYLYNEWHKQQWGGGRLIATFCPFVIGGTVNELRSNP